MADFSTRFAVFTACRADSDMRVGSTAISAGFFSTTWFGVSEITQTWILKTGSWAPCGFLVWVLWNSVAKRIYIREFLLFNLAGLSFAYFDGSAGLQKVWEIEIVTKGASTQRVGCASQNDVVFDLFGGVAKFARLRKMA
jgi:hypothetical protein